MSEIRNNVLAFQIPDFDSGVGSSAQPITIWRESEGVDNVISVQGVQVLSFVEVPEHGGSVFSSGSAEGSVRRNGDGVDVSGVSDEVLSEFELVSELPDLDGSVPRSRDDDRVGGVRRELDARNPVRVSFVVGGELAFSQGVPELDGLVS